MTAQFFDFDRAWAEQDKERGAPEIKAFGERFELPAEMPAKVELFTERLAVARADDDRVELSEMVELLEPLVGQERLDRWLDEGLSVSRAFEVLGAIRAIYVARDVQQRGGGQGEAGARSARARTPSRSTSKAGRSSKRTSPASTGSTSPRRSRKA